MAGAGGGITGVEALAADAVAAGPEDASLPACCWHAVSAMTASVAIRQGDVSDFMGWALDGNPDESRRRDVKQLFLRSSVIAAFGAAVHAIDSDCLM